LSHCERCRTISIEVEEAMNSTIAVAVGGALWAGAGMLGAMQPRPGEPTQAHVWVENRQMHERIPVSVREIGQDVVVRTQVASIPPITLAAGTIVPARFTPQVWEYRSVLVPTGGDPAAALRAAGAEGWETTGVMLPATGGSNVLLKRPGPGR
jgi:hypothetical protein